MKRKLEGSGKQLKRRKPAKRAHRAVVGSCLVHSELCRKIGEGVERVAAVE